MNQFESLYVVWTLEPDYAKEYFKKIYGRLSDFVKNYKPDELELKKAIIICKEKQ